QAAEDRPVGAAPRAPPGRLRVHGERGGAVGARGRFERAGVRGALQPDLARRAAARVPLHAQSRADVLRRSVKRSAGRLAVAALAAAASIAVAPAAGAY